MDISSTLVGSSDQLDNVDLISGPRDFTITGVSPGAADQPLNIALAEFPRPWRPGLTMRRLLAAIWGTDASAYVGRRVRLYRDEKVTFGKDATGGTRLSHASHIEKRAVVTLPVSRGKVDKFTVEPLPDVALQPLPRDDEPTAEQVAASTDQNELRDFWQRSGPETRALIQARVAALNAADEVPGDDEVTR